MVEVKNPLLLVQAFVILARSGTPGTERMRLAMVGAGPLVEEIRQQLQAQGLLDRLWLPGVRADVAEIFRAMDCFVLPSLFEATSCTLQEAMATGLRIVATEVGGNADLLEAGRCGTLVAPQDAQALAAAILLQFQQKAAPTQTQAAIAAIHQHYGLAAVIERYRKLFLT
jgi:glycosyltransferase involved in cell wall biosynthesis